jgi:hypothetical protein
MPRLSFSLRDVFWLTLVVGMGVGWWVRSMNDLALIRLLESDLKSTKADVQKLRKGSQEVAGMFNSMQDQSERIHEAISARGYRLVVNGGSVTLERMKPIELLTNENVLPD